MSKLGYKSMIASGLLSHRGHPGDELVLSIRNEESSDGMYAQARRLSDMFLSCFGFYPQSLVIHPTHLTLIKAMGKSIDITISEETAKVAAAMFELGELPRTIPLLADESLDLFTTKAVYHFRTDQAKDLLVELLKGQEK